MARLVMEREGRTQEYELADETTIGRSSGNTIRVPTGKASRQHARILRDNGGFTIEDLKSSNGTLVNDKKIAAKTRLASGDIIRIGDAQFHFIDKVEDPLIGTHLDKYHILERLGAGGMGSVYRAKQVSLGRDVAIKVMRPDLLDKPGFADNFRREAQLAASLQHPNIIGIYDFGRENDVCFFSMEFVDGENLMDRLQRAQVLPAEEVMAFAAQVVAALDYAHGKRILHQDIKPQNLMVDRAGRIKIADFGLARMMQYGENATGPTMGTPQYVPPEVVRRSPPDPRSDIYSLAATMFHLLTGRPPYNAGNASEIVRRHLEDPVPDPRSVRADVPDALAELVMRGLSKDPARRPATAAEFRQTLEELRQGGSVPAATPGAGAPPTPRRVTEKMPGSSATDSLPRVRGTRTPLIAGIVIAVGVLALLVGLFFYRDYAHKQKARRLYQQAVSHNENARPDEALELLETIVRGYRDTPVAEQARTLREEIQEERSQEKELRSEISRIRMRFQVNLLSAGEAKAQLNALFDRPGVTPEIRAEIEDTLAGIAPREADTDPDDGGEQPTFTEAEREWREVEAVAKQRLAEDKLAEAKRMVERFRDGTEDADVKIEAAKVLEQIDKRIAEYGQEKYESGHAALAAGEKAKARREWMSVLQAVPGTDWAEKVAREIEALDQDARRIFFRALRQVYDLARDLKGEAAVKVAQGLREELAGLAWAKEAGDLHQLAGGLNEFRRALNNAVIGERTSDPDDHASVLGLGLCELRVGKDGQLLAIKDEGEPKAVSWGEVSLADVARLGNYRDLTDQQRLGGAFYSLARRHLGLVKTYLKEVEFGGNYGRLRRQVEALREGRFIVERIAFEDFTRNQRWDPVAGSEEWASTAERFGTTQPGQSAAELRGLRFHVKDIAVEFRAHAEDREGQACLVLKEKKGELLAVRIQGGKVLLEFTRFGEPERVSADLPKPGQPLRLEIRDGTAVLYQEREELARLDVSRISTWNTVLRLELNDTAGWFDDIQIEEGDGPLARDGARG